MRRSVPVGSRFPDGPDDHVQEQVAKGADQHAYNRLMDGQERGSGRLRTFVLKAQSDEVRGKLQRMNPTTDAEYDELFRRLVEIDGELRRLKERSP